VVIIWDEVDKPDFPKMSSFLFLKKRILQILHGWQGPPLIAIGEFCTAGIGSACMSFQNHRPTPALWTIALLFWLQGCAQEASEPISPLTGGRHSDVTVSGYMRSGVMFSGH
jgi:hypothetical protein